MIYSTSFKRLLSTVACAAFVCIGALAQLPVEKRAMTAITPAKTLSANPLQQKDAPRLAPRKTWADTQQEMVLVNEDFSGFAQGTENQPDEACLASYYASYEPGTPWIDAAYTHQAGWSGDAIYQAGGAAYLNSRAAWVGAPLNTPLGDYSGNLTISFRYRGVGTSAAALFVSVCRGGIYYPTAASDDTFTANVPATDEWTEVSLHFTNNYADNDGFIQFNCYGKVLIDDIKITSNYDFIAAPKLLDPTNFTDDGFTANWEPVRKAADYRFSLYKQVYTSDEDSVEVSQDFEDGLPADWNFSEGAQVQSGVGLDGSKGLVLRNADYFTVPYVGARLGNVTYSLKVVVPEGVDVSETTIYVLVSNDGVAYRTYGGFGASYYTEDFLVDDLDYQYAWYGGFANRFKGFGLLVNALPEGAYVVVDDINYTTGRPFTLEQQTDLAYGTYEPVKGTSYTVTGLDPDAEYYYQVKSHLGLLVSDGELVHAFGLAAPKVLEATDIDERGGYTANWTAPAKAQQYTVSNYAVYTATTDELYAVLDEDFSKVDATVTTATDPYAPESLGNSDATSLDDITMLPGWTGVFNTVAQGMVGIEESYYAINYLQTPSLYLDNNDETVVYIKAYGTAGYPLRMYFNDDYLELQFNENGVIDGEFSVIYSGKNVVIRLCDESYYGSFMIDALRISQELKAGDRVYTLLESAETEDTSYRFTGLDDYDFTTFAYNVSASYTFDGQTATSDNSDYQVVSLSDDTPTLISPTAVAGLVGTSTQTEFFTADGRRLSAPQRGLNIVRTAEGRTLKTVVK